METGTKAECVDSQWISGNLPKKANRLIQEKSPYLLQHAYNPVEWFAWGEEAFETARKLDKPIFLSIGYSTCHWCHVMEHESFEDPTIAELMNDTYVSIKVDREERPDIDHVYMNVCQMMTGGGGWPLTIVMTPTKRPFFAGTYFPSESRYGRIGMADLTKRIKELWTTSRQEILQSASKVVSVLRQTPDESPGDLVGKDVLDIAFQQLLERFDEKRGGFGTAPKFPTPHNMLFLLRYWHRNRDRRALEMVEKTLQGMRFGGIYDHVGYGFHRYSTDGEWLVPHFEKMLYDQALLVLAYTESFQVTSNLDFKQTACEILTYVIREMTSPEGGFFSAQDADSEGEEGKFYLWALEEMEQVLDIQERDVVRKVYNLESGGNFQEEVSGKKIGKNIFHLKKSLAHNAFDLGLNEEFLRELLERARTKLFNSRMKKTPPAKDDKILTDWNGLMIGAFAKAFEVFGEPQYAQTARKAADFILATMRSSHGRLLHRYREGEAGIIAHVDDYAFLISGLLDLYQSVCDTRYLKSAIDLNQEFLEGFWDDKAGGFYFTGEDAEELLVRKKDIYDGAIPSGNSVAALNLLRLARITANPMLEIKAKKLIQAFSGNVRQFPSAYTQFLCAVDFALGPSREVVICGTIDADDTSAMREALGKAFLPNKVAVFRPTGGADHVICHLAPYTKDLQAIDGRATAYVCANYACSVPTISANEMLQLLGIS